MIHLTVTVANTAELLDAQAYGPGALLRWESADAQAGSFAEGGTVALVSGTSSYDIWDAAGIAATWYRTRISTAGATSFSAYSAAFQPPVPSLVTPAQVKALVQTMLTDDQVQDVIDREEATLARQITALSGSRTQLVYSGDPASLGLWWDPAAWEPGTRVWILSDRMAPIWLLRPTDAVTVKDNGLTVAGSDVRLLNRGRLVERASGGWRGPLVEVTYTPNDALEVTRVVIELCRLTMTETGYNSERIGDYGYTRSLPGGESPTATRKALIRSLQTHLVHSTMRVRTSSEDGRVGAS
jgi:hypothetical protein